MLRCRAGPVYKRTIKLATAKIQMVVLLVVCLSSGSLAYGLAKDEQQKVYAFDIPALDIQSALNKLAVKTGHQLLFSYKLVNSLQSSAVKGKYTLPEALTLLLEGTDLTGSLTERGVILVTDANTRHDSIRGESGMNTKKSLLASTVAFFVGVGGAQQSVAQNDSGSTDSGNFVLEEIVVTAQKREQNLIDVPISIVALGADEIEARGISSFEDLGSAVPGLSVQDNGGQSRRVFIRGLGNSAGFTSSLIGLYLDEMSVSGNPAFTLDLRPYDMERVEVLRGPQGTLYGDGSVGGTIRFITKKPGLEQFSGKADITASFTEGGDPGQKVQGAVNIPLIDDELGVRVAATYESTGGWIDQPAISKDNYNDQEVFNIRTNLLWRPSEELDVSAMAIVHRNDGSSNTGEDENGNYTQSFGQDSVPSVEDEYELYSITLSYDFGAFELLSSTGYLDTSTEASDFGAKVSIFDALSNNINTGTIFTEELRISSMADGTWNWTVGAFYKDRNIDQTTVEYFGFPGPLPTVPTVVIDNQTSKSWAVFGDVTLAVTERLELGGGLRYFEDDRDFFDGTARQSGTFDSLSPRLYVNFDLTDDIKTYASVAKGFRSGGFNSLGLAEFDPEEIWSYELGSKMSLLDGKLNAELAVFYSEYTDFQILGVQAGSTVLTTSNGGDAEISGLDMALTWQATDSLKLAFSGNYVDSEVVEVNLVSGALSVGDDLDYVSKYSVTLSATQNFELGDRPGYVRLDYNEQDKMFFTNRLFGLQGASDVIRMLNLNVEWSLSESMTIGLFGKNLLDERGYLDPLTWNNTASRPRPRTYGVQVGFDF